MEWCDHCCRFCQTTVENIMDDSSAKYCSSCTTCGKILLDLSTPLQVIFPNKKINRNSRRIKKRNSARILKRNKLDTASKGPLIKEVKQLINSDTTPASDNF